MNDNMKIASLLSANAPVYLVNSMTANPRVDAARYMELGAAIGRVFKAAGKLLVKLNARPNLHRQLSNMDDRLLADIGLTRDDIDAVCNGTYGKEQPAPAVQEPTAEIHVITPKQPAPKVEAILRRAA